MTCRENLARLPTVSVVTASYAMERWDHLREAVASIQLQTVSAIETILVIDHNPDLLDRARRELAGVVVVPNTRDRGVSGARNSGAAASHGDVVAFLDDDSVASTTWLESLLGHFANPDVVGVGCKLVAGWEGSRPRWFPREFDWTVGGSYRGMPEQATSMRNVWSCGMVVSKQVFDAVGGFRDDFGKVGNRSRPEDTDFCLRAGALPARGIWIYEPAGVVVHRVPLDRATSRFFLRRCLSEGSGKAALAALNGVGDSTSAERQYTRRVLPKGLARGLGDAVRGDVSGLLRSMSIAAGFAFVVAGYMAGRAAGSLRPAEPSRVRQAPGNRQLDGGDMARTPRILVDQSGYDLLNLGDIAMLQSCVIRLTQLWPGSEIMVICHAPERLAALCPGATAIGRTFADRPVFRILPRRTRLAAEQAWKIAAPYFCRHLRPEQTWPGQPRTAVQAVRAADVVVASGGGYLTDTWWWHAAGVLSMLSLAQRLGKPTAMLGQGIGPIRAGLHPGRGVLRMQARAVLPRLAVLGLREERMGRDLALSFGTRLGAVTVTGDDGLELLSCGDAVFGHALGVSMRVSRYAGVDLAVADAVGVEVMRAAEAFGAPVVSLPVSRYPLDGDLDALRLLLNPHGCRTNVVLNELANPESLATAAARCRVIVSGSYHAAVFGLAQGVPAVCLTNTRYYDAKFAGLRALFPSACFVVSLDEPDLESRLRDAIDQAWHLPAPARSAATEAAARQRKAGRAAYAQLRDAVEELTPDRRELVT